MIIWSSYILKKRIIFTLVQETRFEFVEIDRSIIDIVQVSRRGVSSLVLHIILHYKLLYNSLMCLVILLRNTRVHASARNIARPADARKIVMD